MFSPLQASIKRQKMFKWILKIAANQMLLMGNTFTWKEAERLKVK